MPIELDLGRRYREQQMQAAQPSPNDPNALTPAMPAPRGTGMYGLGQQFGQAVPQATKVFGLMAAPTQAYMGGIGNFLRGAFGRPEIAEAPAAAPAPLAAPAPAQAPAAPKTKADLNTTAAQAFATGLSGVPARALAAILPQVTGPKVLGPKEMAQGDVLNNARTIGALAQRQAKTPEDMLKALEIFNKQLYAVYGANPMYSMLPGTTGLQEPD